jgi:hypothetical protein
MRHEDPDRIIPEAGSKDAAKQRKEYAFPLWPRVVARLVLAAGRAVAAEIIVRAECRLDRAYRRCVIG